MSTEEQTKRPIPRIRIILILLLALILAGTLVSWRACSKGIGLPRAVYVDQKDMYGNPDHSLFVFKGNTYRTSVSVRPSLETTEKKIGFLDSFVFVRSLTGIDPSVAIVVTDYSFMNSWETLYYNVEKGELLLEAFSIKSIAETQKPESPQYSVLDENEIQELGMMPVNLREKETTSRETLVLVHSLQAYSWLPSNPQHGTTISLYYFQTSDGRYFLSYIDPEWWKYVNLDESNSAIPVWETTDFLLHYFEE